MHRWKVPTLANLFLSGILIDSSAARRRVKRGPQVCCVGPPCTFGALARWQVNINIVWQILPFTILHPDWRFIATTSVSVLWPICGKKHENYKIWIKQVRNSLQPMQWLLTRNIIDGLMAQVPLREIQMAAISPVSIPTSKGYQGWGQLIKTLMVTRLLMPADKLVVSRRWN